MSLLSSPLDCTRSPLAHTCCPPHSRLRLPPLCRRRCRSNCRLPVASARQDNGGKQPFQTRAAAAEVEADVIPRSSDSPLNLGRLSYSAQYDRLFSQPIDAKKPVPKPSKQAQQEEEAAKKGDPIEWASSHRYHHLHTDTPLDPHSPYEGFWWSHMGWLLDNKATLDRVGTRGNTTDLEAQPFYTWIQKTYSWHVVAQLAGLFLLGGLPALVWGGALRIAWVYHITWFVNSASHCWGRQTYNTGDLSRNNWWVGLLAFGEGWHNNHHAFEFSARHGLKWWQVDTTWMVIRTFQLLGLAQNVKLPTEKQKARLAL
ncbi:hypothetical protein WJX84_002952 [Apatococcus fuscideae]|uniref:Fatty acid desaturase domain-containing protein n=1 Tax=Apatococcus fuscideae TaxID=2026836 RepID=A0AAW1SR08_9CHLO